MTQQGLPQWKIELISRLKERDTIEKPDSSHVIAFQELYQRFKGIESKYEELAGTDLNQELIKSQEANLNSTMENLELNKRLESLQTKHNDLIKVHNDSVKRVGFLNNELSTLSSKLSKRTEEHSERDKSIELINDEMNSLDIQNNLLLERVKGLEKENEDLVKRWLAKVKSDAEKMNDML
ncbi:hypothetical protein WICPIJ_004910 [Wickerhamomyces pijperi]|uniref:Autophagy-related protein 16 domain-containing protein n=1 Tax=Wickerhamomyces pijperi TaxID=599730 RepID=A0A9P8Q744_WICPI|nr:hypothetical protein WICPIJ_004910 [Wickerhamomyces pijperi]